MKKRLFSLFTSLIMVISLVGVMPSMTANAGVTLIWPVPGHTSLSRNFAAHSNKAIDISDSNIAGATIVAALGGTVYAKYTHTHQGYVANCSCGNLGTGVIIRGTDGRYYQYAHMMAGSIPSNVYQGATVSAGQKLGQVGKTGYATGYCMHFEINTQSAWSGHVNPMNENYGNNSPTFGTPYTTTVGQNSAYIKCTIGKNGSNWSQVGAYYGTTTACSIRAGSDNLGSGNSWAGYTLSNLSAGTTYYYKFYINANGTTYWSSVQSFKTPPNTTSAPTFGTPYTTTLGQNSAYIKCTIGKNGSNWSQVGAYYGTTTACSIKAGSDNLGSGNSWAGYTLSNLSAETTYYYKFYINANGTTYWSSVQSFKTTGHNYKTTVVKPTCTAKGYTLHKCSTCGNEYKDTYTNATGHKFGSWTTTKAATCTAAGTQTRKCSTCGVTETLTIKATGHKYTTTVVKPTCTEKGYTLHKCSTCGNEYKDNYTNATGHKFGSWTTTKAATCIAAGTQTRKCTTCGVIETQTIKATGHNYSTQWTVDKQATCTSEGSKSHHCLNCGAKKDITSIAKTAHNWTYEVVGPSYADEGYTYVECSECGDYYYTDYTDQLKLANVKTASFKSSADSVKMTWKKIKDADGYRVYKYNTSKKKWEKVATTSNTSYTFTKLKAGTTYYFTVRAYVNEGGQDYLSPSFTKFTTSTNPAKVNFKLTAGSKKVTVKWSKVTGATGYIVYYKTSKNGSWQKLKTTTGTSYTKTGLTKGKTYWFTVKAYRKVDGKTYNGAFTTKSVKVK